LAFPFPGPFFLSVEQSFLLSLPPLFLVLSKPNHKKIAPQRTQRTQRKLKKVRRQESEATHFGSLISDWGLKNRNNIEAKRQNPKSAFQNPKCIGSSTPTLHYSII
jgi:hypothetical protein